MTIAIETEQRPLSQILAEDLDDEVILLTRNGETRYALVPFDDLDEEVMAIRKNPELLASLAECVRRARNGPTIPLEDITKELELETTPDG